MNICSVDQEYFATKNTILGEINLSEYFNPESKKTAENAWINIGGWQSWNPGFEIEPGKKQPSLHCHIIHQWNRYLEFPQSVYRPSKNIVLGQFIVYLRWEETYLVIASCGNIKEVLPPVQFIINRKKNTVTIELCDKGKHWVKNEIQAKIEIFTADSYFDCRHKLEQLFGNAKPESPDFSKRFDQISHLGLPSLGWESWYNHYADINENLILDDLQALNKTENYINLTEAALNEKNQKNTVFQIDDGWELQLGTWEPNTERFSNGLKSITEKIENAGYIPGLWIAPFIIDERSKIAQEHPEWILRNLHGKKIPAGFNPLWGKHGSFYCLDLSISEAVDYLDNLIEKAIEEWGFRFLKLDFLYAGMIYGNYTEGGAGYIWYNRAVEKLTSRKINSKGQPVCYLGCGLPFEQSFKYFPLSRIGCDTFENWENNLSKRLNWNGRNSAYLNLKDTIGHAMWDKIIYANDPDVIFIRKENCTLSKDEKILIAAIDQMFGSQLMYSDDPAKSTSAEEIELTKEIVELQKKLGKEEFCVINTGADTFEFCSQSKTIKGKINLAAQHKIIFE